MATSDPSLSHQSTILVVGAGVFGLSTALWLARAGYENVTVLDMQDISVAGYDPSRIDSASADINKIVRFSYGTEVHYQRLASEAAQLWEQWNQDAAACGSPKLWYNRGMVRMSATNELGAFELQTLRNMEQEGIRDRQFRTDDAADVARAHERGWAHKLDPCRRQQRFGVHKAVLDSTAGFVAANRSCEWVRMLAEKAGVRFFLDRTRGKVVTIDEKENRPVVKTADGLEHVADLVVVAGGGWTPSLLPEVSHLRETTAGSVGMVTIPRDKPDIWDRFAPENFPVITWGMKEGVGLYSFSRDDNGIVKIGYRATKWTNYDDVNGHYISIPKTAHITGKKETNVPKKAMEGIKKHISVNMPDLVPLGLSATKLCWYTDSIDNSFVVDYVPGCTGVAVCSGGSGHGFKFLPILGREVVKILEKTDTPTVYARMWRWRSADPSAKTRNGLEEGASGSRVLTKQPMANRADWVFTERARV